ncbi:MAG: GldG family protein [Granulosicoccus sp.]
MKSRSSILHVVLSVLIVVIVLVLGWFTQRFNTTMDITANDRHSLADSTILLLQSLDAPVEVIAVLGPNPQQRSGVEALVGRFQEFKTDINLRFINPETDPAQARSLDVAPGGELILRTGEREQRLQTLSERSLVDSLQQLSREGNRDIVFVTGHDERSPSGTGNDDWLLISERLANIGLLAREQSLVSDPYLSDDIDLLVIAAPKRPYFPGELASLDSYLNRGGNLLWLTEADNNGAAITDLSLLSNTLGVDMLPGTVIDTASQALAADSPDFVLLDRFPAHPVTLTLASPILLPQATALAITPLAGQVVEPLLQTPESSWTETGPLAGAIKFDENTSEVSGPLLLGVTIERTLTHGTQRFAVIGDADFAASQFLGNGANQGFTEALVLWLVGDADELDFITQRAPDSELSLSNRSIVALSVIYLAALPLSLLLMAALVRWRRNSNR